MKNKSYTIEHELLCAIAAGDQAAFCSLFQQLKDKVYSFATLFSHSGFIAEEITQEVFIKIWVNRATLTEINNIEAWVSTVTKNLCFNYLKKKALDLKAKNSIAGKEQATENNVTEYISYKEQQGMLKRAMDQLSPQQRIIFRLNREDGLKNEEIARQLNIAPNTVKTHMVSALRKVRKFMQAYPVNLFFTIAMLLKFFSW